MKNIFCFLSKLINFMNFMKLKLLYESLTTLPPLNKSESDLRRMGGVLAVADDDNGSSCEEMNTPLQN